MIKKEGKIAIDEVDSGLVFDFSDNVEKWIGKNIDRMAKDIDTKTKQDMFQIIKTGVQE